MTFLLLLLNPLILFMGFGIENLFLEKYRLKCISRLISLAIILFIPIKLIYFFDFAVDERWYLRFPRALKGTSISYIGDDLRTKKEDPVELIAQKKYLTQGNLLPRLYKNRISIPDKLNSIKRELSQKDITVVDFWRYIYEK